MTPTSNNNSPPEDLSEKKWYHAGLPFQCSGCGNCCTGAPGYVWVNFAEAQAIAREIGETDLEQFLVKYTDKIGDRYSLKELPKSYDCIFFNADTRKCQVYNVRPGQCRTWPFWNSNLESEANWEDVCHICPGSGQGRVVPFIEIERLRKEVDI